jgi:Tol biopolymer transport system component/N-acetylneuraminic acid mutarotase
MKTFILLFLGAITSCSSFADFVYMKEDNSGKSVQLKRSGAAPVTISTTSSGVWALYPDISSNGQEIIFAEGPGQDDLSLTYLDLKKNQTQKFRLPQKGMLLHPKFSKNGQWIFYSAPGPQGKNAIYYFDRALEVAQQGEGLTEYSLANAKLLGNEEAYFPRPSSDGNFVVYQRNQAGKKEIVLFDRLENKKKILAEGMSPALSFDERHIAYTSKKDGNWNIYVVDRVSGEVIQKTSDAKDEMAPSFTPDNSLVFASNKSGQFRLFQLQDDKWIALTETNREVDFYSPQFAGDKKYLQNLRAPFIGNPRSSFGTVFHEGKLYMAGGHQGAEHTYPPESFSDQFIVYDESSNQWRELAPRPAKAHGYQIVATGNYIYAFGGFAYSPDHKPKWKSLDQIDRYDIRTNTWTTVAKLLEPRSSNAAILVQNKVYLVGGWNSTPKFNNDADGKFHDTIEIFDVKSEKVELASYKIPAPVRRAFTGVERNGKLLLVGGLGEGASHFELLNKVTEINPLDGSFKELTPLPFATFAPAAGILGDELMVFGGMFKTGPMNYEYVAHIYAMNLDELSWRHTGRYLKETKGFSQVFSIDDSTLGILGGHHYSQDMDLPVTTFETISR